MPEKILNAQENIGHKRGPFIRFASKMAYASGCSGAFILALATIIVWAVTGPFFGFSNTWQLVINTGTTIVTFLMVFLIQNSQNRDTHAIQLKLDELLRATDGAHVALLDLEELEEGELAAVRAQYSVLARAARIRLRNGLSDTDIPDVGLKFS